MIDLLCFVWLSSLYLYIQIQIQCIQYIQLFQKMLSGRMTNVNCRTAIARLKGNVGIEY